MTRQRPRLLCVALLLALSAAASAAPFQCTGNKVVCGNARFTVLSPTLLRLESAPSGAFADEPSVLVLNRDLGAVAFQVSVEDEWLVIRTAALELRWLVGALPFDETNLMVSWRTGEKAGTWRPGRQDQGYLGGTRGALDGIGQGNLPPLDPGLLSREGWTLLDDSERPLWLGEAGWLKQRADYSNRDWYFFAYGRDYPHMLQEYVNLCGRIPMLPRYAWGAWYSRYWPYTDQEEKGIVSKFRELRLPLDVLVVDVDWHNYGWEGYDWNEKLFPDPKGFLNWCHDNNVAVTLNNHPGAGLPAEDTHLPAAAQMAGVTGDAAKQALAWDLADPKSNQAFVEAVHWPLENLGVDFWWIDGAAGSQMRGLNSDVWCAKTYFDGTQRRTGQRSLTFSRYGGLGQHRYPAGFSGDVHSEWDVLNYEVRYTARAGNVAFPYWSHDIGGFLGDKLDPELYVRWCQFGALSPILRLHSNHGVREPWNYGDEAQQIVKQYFDLRMRLYPYLNACQREVYDTGLPLCRALYMQWPDREEAYQYDYEYMLGPDLLVAPITTPSVDGVATKELWIPPGLWWDYWTGEPVEGPRTMVYQAALARCPLFVRAGAVIPMQPDMEYMGEKPADPITLDVWPGASGRAVLYEDDGVSLDYQKGAAARTAVALDSEDTTLRITIPPRNGSFPGALPERRWCLNVHATGWPARVSVEGVAVEVGFWRHDGRSGQTTVNIPPTPADRRIVVTLRGVAGAEELAQRARLWPMLACANRADKLAAAKGLPDDARRPLYQLRAAPNLESAESLFPAVWQSVAESALSAPDREAVLRELIGLTVSARMTTVEGSSEPQARIAVGTLFPLPGAELTAKAVADPLWPIQGEPVVRLSGTDASVSFRVQSPNTLAAPKVGLVEMGADLTLQYAGVKLPLSVRTGVDCSFVQLWHLIGPWPNEGGKGLETVYPPEEGIDLAKSYPIPSGEAKWQETAWVPPAGGDDPALFINLEPRFQPKDQATAYAVAYLWSATEQPCILSIGSDDGCKVWLNGDLVLTHPEPRPPSAGQDKVEAALKPGVNSVVFKVVNEGGQWGLYCQVTDRAGKPLRNLVNLRTPADAAQVASQEATKS